MLDAKTRLAVFKQLFAGAADLCQQHGAAFVLVYFPFQAQYEPWIIQRVMYDLADTKGIKTLDLMDVMKLANRVHPAYIRPRHSLQRVWSPGGGPGRCSTT